MQFVSNQPTTQFVPAKNVEELKSGLKKLFETNEVNVEQVKAYLHAYVPIDSDWKDKVKFVEGKVTRVLLHEEKGKFNLMLICWERGFFSKIHDHSSAHCFMKGVSGKLTEQLYEWPEITESGSATLDVDDFKKETILDSSSSCYVNDHIGLHRVGNPSSDERAVSMHVYSPPFRTCQVYDHDSQSFKTVDMLFDNQPPK